MAGLQTCSWQASRMCVDMDLGELINPGHGFPEVTWSPRRDLQPDRELTGGDTQGGTSQEALHPVLENAKSVASLHRNQLPSCIAKA